MAFSTPDLLLTAKKLAQLKEALGNQTSLDTICAEAEAEVNRLLAGYTVEEAVRKSFIRALALHQAYGLVGPIPDAVQKLYDRAQAELAAIAEGRRPNTPRSDDPRITGAVVGNWGAHDKISFRF